MANKNQSDADKRLENVEGALNTTESFIEQYQNQISWGLLIVILIVFGIFALNKYVLAPRADKASFELSKAEYQFGEKNWQVALEGDGAENIGFVGVIEDYGSTEAGKIAKYYAGICSYKLGNYEDALDYLKSFNSKNEIINLQAKILLGDVYAELNDADKAIAAYEKVVKKNNPVLSPVALKKQGVAYESLGKKAEACKSYQKIKDDFNSSNEARDIDKYIARVK